MSIVVFWIARGERTDEAEFRQFEDTELGAALSWCEVKRKDGARHVTLSSELSNMVGHAGVDTVADGKTPDGQTYDWSKADRAGKVRRK